MDKENIIRLLLINDSDNDAEETAKTLRNAGYALRPKRIDAPDSLQESLKKHPWDMIIARPLAGDFSAFDALDILNQEAMQIPLIVLDDHNDDEQKIELLNAGARDVIPDEPEELLPLIVGREFTNYKDKRKLTTLESRLNDSERRCQLLIESSRDAIAYIHEGMHIHTNESYLKRFGYHNAEDLEGVPIMDLIGSEDQSKVKDFLRTYTALSPDKINTENSLLETIGVCEDGSEFNMKMEFEPATMDGENCTQIIIRDNAITEELQQQLDILSSQDVLTGLYNRKFFLEKLDKMVEIANSGTQRSNLLYISIDNFEDIKEKVGIASSDLIITDVADILKENLPGNTIIAYFNGHIFTAILDISDLQEVQQISQNLCKIIHDHITETDNGSISPTCSIGINPINESSPGPQEVLSRAAKASEAASKEGGNRFHMYNIAEGEMADRELQAHWVAKIETALSNNKFRLVYQPIVSLQGDTNENYEVFLRMIDEEGNTLFPNDFLPAAEKSGQTITIDRWVIANAIKVLGERRQSGIQCNFFISISTASLSDETLLPWISHHMKKYRLTGNALIFTLSEEQTIDNLKYAKRLLKFLKQLHCRFLINNFGKDPKSFTLLKHIDADILKIDGSLIQDIASNESHLEQVQNIAAQATEMGKVSIAGSVEEASSLSMIWQCGVSYIQGHFLQEPSEHMVYDFSSFS